MTSIPFAFMTASGRSQSLNAERLINLYAEPAARGSRSPLVLRSAPGAAQFAIEGTGPIRGWHEMNMLNAQTAFAVSGNDLYEIDSGGTGTLRGAAGTIAGAGPVSMASNANDELVITNSAGTGWVWDGTTLAALSSLDADFTDDATNVTFLDQFIIYGKKNTGQAFASDLNNAKSWNALSFGTAESAPDNIVEVFAHAGQLWLLGEKTTEAWFNTGGSPFAFARIGGAVQEDVGAIAGTVANVDQSMYRLAQDGIVYRVTGIQSQRISTHEIENRLRGRTGFRAWTYKDEGHAFYVLGSDQGAVVFDASTGLWHERETFTVGRYRSDSHVFAYGKHLVGDYLLGIIYDMNLETYVDGDNALQRQVISAPVEASNGSRVPISEIQVHFEHGVGLSGPPVTEFFSENLLDEDGSFLLDEEGFPLLTSETRLVDPQGVDPHVLLDVSTDGGKTFGNQRAAQIGKIGEYVKRAVWRRFGAKRSRNFRLIYSDPTRFTIYGANVK